MAGRRNGPIYECVVFDLNTQLDYCAVGGARPVANVYELITAMRHLIAWVKWNAAPVISSIESHRPCELSSDPEQNCCVDGSAGQHKVDFTVLERSARVEVDNTLCCPADLFRKYQQVIFRKRTEDLLGNPKADRFLSQLPTDEFIIFGVGLEGAVKALALALLAREKHVTVVTDACGYWNLATAELAKRQIMAKGADLITLSELLSRKLARPRRRNGFISPSDLDVARHNGRKDRANGTSRKVRQSSRLPKLLSKPRIPRADEE